MKNLIEELKENNVAIALNGDHLEINFDGQLDAELLTKLKSNKQELIALLKSYSIENQFSDILPLQEADHYAISNAQRRLWILGQYEDGSVAYNLPNTVELFGEYDKDIFDEAINKVVKRHEILRTIFKEDEYGEIRQWVIASEKFKFNMDFVDLRNQENGKEELFKYISQDSYKAFDLENGPLLRVSLLQLEDQHYVFYYNMHHIISDGWSMDVLINDTKSFYESLKQGVPETLPKLQIHYKDFAGWQLEQLKNDSFNNDKKYWGNYLSGTLPILNLPSDKLRPPVFSYSGRQLSTLIDAKKTALLLDYCKSNGGTLFMGLLSLWSILFHKYTSQKDIVIGSPVAGREHADLVDQIGFYINTLVHRNEVDPKASFDAFFETVKKNVLSSFDHQQYPFDVLLDDLGLERDMSRNALFDVLLTLQNTGKGSSDNGFMQGEEVGVIKDHGPTFSQMDLVIDFQEIGDELYFQLIYNDDIYEDEMIRNMMLHFTQIIEGLLEAPSQQISRANYLPTSERTQLLEVFNASEVELCSTTSFLDLFQKYVDETPNKTALRSDERSLIYQELDNLSSQLANYLSTVYPLSKGDLVVINTERSQWLLTSILAIFKLGCAYIPIDPSYPEDRKQYILDDSNSDYVIDQSLLNSFNAVSHDISTEFTSEILEPEDLAYVIYTSGSTGKPKGVMIEHRGMMNHLYAMERELSLNEQSIIVQNAPYTFDISVWQLLNALIVGGTTSIFSQDTVLNSKQFLEKLESEHITILQVVPSYLKVLLDTDVDFNQRSFQNLNYLLVTGEAVSMDVVSRWFDLYPEIQLVNAYGPAEASDDVTLHIMSAVPEGITVPVGKVIDNMSLYILDEGLELCGKGIVGEICVSGIGLAKGYLNRPELTEQKFINHPFKKGERLYRTGDLGRIQKDGIVEFVGRKDNQVKVNGHRIELGEIEHYFLAIQDIKGAVVLPTENEGGRVQLALYFEAISELNITELREYTATKMPFFMVPSYFIQLERLPLTPNGKIDRKALPSPLSLDLVSGLEYVAPKTANEIALISVCQDVLNREQIGVKDNFFNLGGDSIKSIQVVSRLRQNGYTLKVDQILQHPILERLAGLMSIETRTIDQSTVEGIVPLTPIQCGFFKDEKIKNRQYYNQSVVLKTSERLDLEVVESCLKELVCHHDALRMVFKSSEDKWTQYNLGDSSNNFGYVFHDLSNLDHPKEEMLSIGTSLQSSINLEEGPLMKVGHFRLEDGDYLALIIHHLVVDGVSWRILMEDLSTLFIQAQKGIEFSLPLKTDSFQTWSVSLNEYAHSIKFQKEHQYWEALSDIEVPELPRDKISGKRRVQNTDVSFTINEATTALIQSKIHSTYNTEMNDLLLASLGLAIKDTLGVNKSVLRMEGHGREEFIKDIDVTRTLGWFTSEFPFLLDVSSEEGVIDALIDVKESLRKIPNKGLGFGLYQHLLDTPSKSLTPHIEFNYLGDFGAGVGANDNDSMLFEYTSEQIGSNSDIANNESDVLFLISGMIVSNKLEIFMSYSDEDYESETIEKLSDAFKGHLESYVKLLSTAEDSYLTPSDLSYSLVSKESLKELNKDLNILDVYRLSPLQHGFYYHWLSDKTNKLYSEQMSYGLSGGEINVEAVKKAFDDLIARHNILRTSFTNQLSDETLQVVHRKVPSNFHYEKLPSKLSESERKAYVKKAKEEDVLRGFDLSKPSQMRLTVLDLGEANYELIWSHHHILMDGWCMGIIINEFTQIFVAYSNGYEAVLPAIVPYSNYIKWLDSLDKRESLNYWKSYLSGYDKQAVLPFQMNSYHPDMPYDKVVDELVIDGSVFRKIEELCKELEVTQNIFVQGVWGYLLSRYNQTNDVVFGTITSGRPAQIDGIEDMLGLFINTIPIRVRFDPEETPSSLLKRLQTSFLDGDEFRYMSLSEVQAQSTLGMELINHTLTFENYPLEESILNDNNSNEDGNSFKINSLDVHEQMNYHFGILIYATGDKLTFNFEYNRNKYDGKLIKGLYKRFETLIESFGTKPNEPLIHIESAQELVKKSNIKSKNLNKLKNYGN